MTVTRSYRHLGGTVTGFVSMTPNATMVNDGETVVRAARSACPDAGGVVTLTGLVANDDPDTEPTEVESAYQVIEAIQGAATRTYHVRLLRTAGVPVGGVRVIDLADLDELSAPPALVAPLRKIRQAIDYDDSVPPIDEQILAFDAGTAKWRPVTGTGGAGATPDSIVLTRVASGALSGHRLVVPTTGASVEYADNATVTHRGAPLWLTLGAAASGAAVQVLANGLVTESSWSWTRGPLHLGTNGQLTQAAPTAPALFLAVVGFATSPTTAVIDPRPPIALT